MLFLVMVVAYLIGSIPMGFVIVKAVSGQDVRQVGSGRTGGTNAMRAAGLSAGLLTALLDALNGNWSQEIAPAYSPYPKPTQVDWQSMLRRLRELC